MSIKKLHYFVRIPGSNSQPEQEVKKILKDQAILIEVDYFVRGVTTLLISCSDAQLIKNLQEIENVTIIEDFPVELI